MCTATMAAVWGGPAKVCVLPQWLLQLNQTGKHPSQPNRDPSPKFSPLHTAPLRSTSVHTLGQHNLRVAFYLDLMLLVMLDELTHTRVLLAELVQTESWCRVLADSASSPSMHRPPAKLKGAALPPPASDPTKPRHAWHLTKAAKALISKQVNDLLDEARCIPARDFRVVPAVGRHRAAQ